VNAVCLLNHQERLQKADPTALGGELMLTVRYGLKLSILLLTLFVIQTQGFAKGQNSVGENDGQSSPGMGIQSQKQPESPIAQTRSTLLDLADGAYQFCSQPQPNDWRDGAGVCLNFQKQGSQIDGYYGYPHSDSFICIRGEANGNSIRGRALALSWMGEQWDVSPEAEFKWDAEGHLSLSQAHWVDGVETIDDSRWLLFDQALLEIDGFYQYDRPQMQPSSNLCNWSGT
jgi:hypothetical protein